MQLVSEPRAPTTKTPAKSPKKSPEDIQSSTSSSSINSTKSINSALSISTGQTSTDPPPVEPCSFSPVSPVDHPFKQTFFGTGAVQEPAARPESRVGKERKPTPIPPRTETQSVLGNHRYPTPLAQSRPSSPKSRNASRSRGPTLLDSPDLSEIQQEDILLTRARFSNHWITEPDLIDSPVLGEFQAEDIRLSRAHFSNSRITQSVSVGVTEHKPCVAPAAEPEIEPTVTRPNRAASENSSQYESSFTKNTLGPRSRHISPRPRSTVW